MAGAIDGHHAPLLCLHASSKIRSARVRLIAAASITP
jgi:hypothetical protein